jgi:hypothetical protein
MYSALVTHLTNAYSIAKNHGVEDQSLSKALLDIVLANRLGHYLSEGGRGSDAYDTQQRHYEYKCTFTKQCIFHFGSNNGVKKNIAYVRQKFQHITGCYYAEINSNGIERIAYCPMSSFLPQLENHIRSRLKAGQFQWHHTWKTFTKLPNCVTISSIGVPTYPELSESLIRAFGEAEKLELEAGFFSKGAHNHIFLAHREGHRLAKTGGGADASDANGKYEYKISYKDRWNFHFGARKSHSENRKLIKKKCDNIAAAYFVTRRYAEITRIIRIPAKDLLRLLLEKEAAWGGGQLLLNIDRNDLKRFVLHPNPDYEWMNETELKAELRIRKLTESGKKTVLIERLTQHDLR